MVVVVLAVVGAAAAVVGGVLEAIVSLTAVALGWTQCGRSSRWSVDGGSARGPCWGDN